MSPLHETIEKRPPAYPECRGRLKIKQGWPENTDYTIEPRCQRQGTGSKLIHLGLQRAIEESIPHDRAEAPAYDVFVKMGFKDTMHFDIDLRKYAPATHMYTSVNGTYHPVQDNAEQRSYRPGPSLNFPEDPCIAFVTSPKTQDLVRQELLPVPRRP